MLFHRFLFSLLREVATIRPGKNHGEHVEDGIQSLQGRGGNLMCTGGEVPVRIVVANQSYVSSSYALGLASVSLQIALQRNRA